MTHSPTFTAFCTRVLTTLHFETTRTRLLALFVFIALFSTVALSAKSAGSITSRFFGGAAVPAANKNSAPLGTAPPNLKPLFDTGLGVARTSHTATLLTNSELLVVGGENQNGFVTEAEIYDPATGSFSVSGNLNTPRADHSATRLADGRVLIAGGRGNLGPLNTTEIFDPTSGAFTNGPNLNSARAGHSATKLDDGRIVFAGGDTTGGIEILDAVAGASSSASAMSGARSMHSAAVMLDGRILFVGGRDAAGNSLSSGEIFNPADSSCASVDVSLKVARVRPHLRVLFDGKIQVIGGSNDGSLEIYDPQINAFGAYVHAHPEGDFCAGLPAQIQASQTRAALFHNGQSDATYDRSRHTMNDFTRQAVVIGGANSSGDALNSAPVFNSSTAEISTDKLDYSPGETAHISGRGFEPGEIVRIKVHEDPHTPLERGMDVGADNEGRVVATYVVQDYDLHMKFLVGARGLTSGKTAQTSFTDSSAGDHFRTVASGNWNSTATWESSPDGESWTAATLTPTSTANTITIRNGHTVSVTSNVLVDQVTIQTGGQVNVNSGVTWTIAEGTGTDLTVNGTVVNSNIITTTGTVIFNDGSEYDHARNAGIVPTATWDASSLVEITGVTSTMPTGLGQTFGHFTWNATGQTSGLQLNTDMSIAGTFTVSNTGGQELRVNANASGTTALRTVAAKNFAQTDGIFVLVTHYCPNVLLGGDDSSLK